MDIGAGGSLTAVATLFPLPPSLSVDGCHGRMVVRSLFTICHMWLGGVWGVPPLGSSGLGKDPGRGVESWGTEGAGWRGALDVVGKEFFLEGAHLLRLWRCERELKSWEPARKEDPGPDYFITFFIEWFLSPTISALWHGFSPVPGSSLRLKN